MSLRDLVVEKARTTRMFLEGTASRDDEACTALIDVMMADIFRACV